MIMNNHADDGVANDDVDGGDSSGRLLHTSRIVRRCIS